MELESLEIPLSCENGEKFKLKPSFGAKFLWF